MRGILFVCLSCKTRERGEPEGQAIAIVCHQCGKRHEFVGGVWALAPLPDRARIMRRLIRVSRFNAVKWSKWALACNATETSFSEWKSFQVSAEYATAWNASANEASDELRKLSEKRRAFT